jgi:hypothetical protein
VGSAGEVDPVSVGVTAESAEVASGSELASSSSPLQAATIIVAASTAADTPMRARIAVHLSGVDHPGNRCPQCEFHPVKP